jgi:hypothetical protein
MEQESEFDDEETISSSTPVPVDLEELERDRTTVRWCIRLLICVAILIALIRLFHR